MIVLDGVTKSFGRVPVLRGVNLTASAGRVLALVGPNGAGKTTLVKSILGLARPDGGRVLFDGERVSDDPEYRSRIGYMSQIARFPENLSGAELLALLRRLRPDAAVDDSLLRAFGLDAMLQKPLRTLSGGTRQKVNAVTAWMFRPDVLILDEPTAGLDPVSSSILKDAIGEARARGCTVLVSSHVLAELDEIADDVAFLLDGTVRYSGSVRDLKLATRQLSLERAVAHMMREMEAA